MYIMSKFIMENRDGSFRCSRPYRDTLLQWQILCPRECSIGMTIMHVSTTLDIIVMFCLRSLGSYPFSPLLVLPIVRTIPWFVTLIFITSVYKSTFQVKYGLLLHVGFSIRETLKYTIVICDNMIYFIY